MGKFFYLRKNLFNERAQPKLPNEKVSNKLKLFNQPRICSFTSPANHSTKQASVDLELFFLCPLIMKQSFLLYKFNDFFYTNVNLISSKVNKLKKRGSVMKSSLRTLILAAEFAAIIAVLSQLTIPMGIIPLTGQTFAVGLTATILGKRTGTYAIFIYLLLGLIGLPVFAGMKGGLGVLFGPTGGYLIGFIFNGLITGYFLEKTDFTYTWGIIANLIGAIATLFFGTIWLKFSGDLSWSAALAGGFTPFILPGIIKALAAAYCGILIRKRISKRYLTLIS
jgi:biotin transport system substrate-specific component